MALGSRPPKVAPFQKHSSGGCPSICRRRIAISEEHITSPRDTLLTLFCKEVKAEKPGTSVMVRLGGDTLDRCDDDSCISADDLTAGPGADKSCAPDRNTHTVHLTASYSQQSSTQNDNSSV